MPWRTKMCRSRRVPYPGGNEVVQLITCAERKSLRHRLNALAIARTDQARHVERTHPSPRLVTQTIHKRLEPTSKRVSPIQCPASHGRPLQESRPPMSHRKSDLVILRRIKSAKLVLGCVHINRDCFGGGWLMFTVTLKADSGDEWNPLGCLDATTPCPSAALGLEISDKLLAL